MTGKTVTMRSSWLWILILGMIVATPCAAATGQSKNVCVECHGSLDGRLGEPVKLWRKSLHAEHRVACNGCHGGDPDDAANAMSPARGFLGVPADKDIPAFCGRCHVGVLKDYLASAHGRALGNGGPTCVSCHGNHLVVKASLELINEKTCTRCHDFVRAQSIKQAMQDTESIISAIENRTTGYKRKGTDTDRLEKGLFEVRNRFHRLFHNVDTEKVIGESVRIRGELKKLEELLREMDETAARRKTAGAIAVAGALVAAGLLHLLAKSYGR